MTSYSKLFQDTLEGLNVLELLASIYKSTYFIHLQLVHITSALNILKILFGFPLTSILVSVVDLA